MKLLLIVTKKLIKELEFSSVQETWLVTLLLMIFVLVPVRVETQAVKFILRVKNSVMLKDNLQFLLDQTLKQLLVWLIPLWLRKELPPYLMKWLIRNCWNLTFSLSILLLNKMKLLERNQTLLSVTMIKANSLEIFIGTMSNSNTCSELNSMTLRWVEKLWISAQTNPMDAWLLSILVLLWCPYQLSLSIN